MSKTTKINTNWFCQTIGNDTLVPIRYYPSSSSTKSGVLDAEGRSMECQTKYRTMLEWIQQQQQQSLSVGENEYLKDWHLLQLLKQQQPPPPQELYQVPKIFPKDVLNEYLLTYMENSDYRFVYWGPQGSRTEYHSDVLHSFSWSYNVVGTKRWILHIPTIDKKELTVVQQMGDTMFVPSTWKHSVENVEETLSINHNWMTANIVDQMYHCISIEQQDICKELQAWNNAYSSIQEYYTIQETMLQNCCGIHTTSFLLLILINSFKLLLSLHPHKTTNNHDDNWETTFELTCFYQVLKTILLQDYDDDLQQRLEASLQSKQKANNLLHISNILIHIMDTNILETK